MHQARMRSVPLLNRGALGQFNGNPFGDRVAHDGSSNTSFADDIE